MAFWGSLQPIDRSSCTNLTSSPLELACLSLTYDLYREHTSKSKYLMTKVVIIGTFIMLFHNTTFTDGTLDCLAGKKVANLTLHDKHVISKLCFWPYRAAHLLK